MCSLTADKASSLNCGLQVEQVNVMESTGDPLVLALRSLPFYLFNKNKGPDQLQSYCESDL